MYSAMYQPRMAVVAAGGLGGLHRLRSACGGILCWGAYAKQLWSTGFQKGGCLGVVHRVPGVQHRVLGVVHRVPGVQHRVLGVLHRVPGVQHRVLGVPRRFRNW